MALVTPARLRELERRHPFVVSIDAARGRTIVAVRGQPHRRVISHEPGAAEPHQALIAVTMMAVLHEMAADDRVPSNAT